MIFRSYCFWYCTANRGGGDSGIYHCGIFLIRALSRYVKSGNVRKEKSSIKKSLGEVLKQHREECKMTQEFVAESIGVSRQAVSKWETGASDPSTSNLLTLAKLFNTTAEELLREVQ